ncbi:mycothiol conjugate amidase Mca [Brevibacterium sp. BRM-1]|uniref:mycothiol conjugate amidase Mca n=1 Tax=Brevibacterium sp. BRM-1 TaxID=2999062 RepID=UPI00227F261D|nr:mycothiol conjugate amidase Mca [Brevibacterium sp. BRM-1]WAL40364.1 mycothiol conjugate amidase Mca [Brevibacterium sp. BRM-1]
MTQPRGAQPYAGLRLLAVHAHPDDESSKGAATSAMYAQLGAQVRIATMTGGEAGDILNPALADSPTAQRDIAGLRRREMARAAQLLGAEHDWVGFVDSGLPEGDFDEQVPHGVFWRVPTEVAARPLVNIIRRFRPQVVTTYDEQGGYPHPDHIKNHFVTMAAVAAAADPDDHPELGEAWQVQKVYYNQDLSARKWLTIHEQMLADGVESPFGKLLENYRDRDAKRDTWLSTRVPSGAFAERAEQALLAHATQIDPKGGFFSDVRAAAKRYWPTEEFELALDDTGRPPLQRRDFVEDDLFAGVVRDDGTRVPDGELGRALEAAGFEAPLGRAQRDSADAHGTAAGDSGTAGAAGEERA